jgi:flagellar protein FliO/FliZ
LIELVLRIGFSLLVVFGLMWGLARLARRPLGGNRGTGALSILNRQQLSRGASVTVVKVADRALVLGVTDQHVTIIGETDLESFDDPSPAVEHREPAMWGPSEGKLDGSVFSRRTWQSMVEFLRDRTVRR